MIVELVPPNSGRAFEAMRELRPALDSVEAFVEQVDNRQRPAGYRLIAVVTDEASAAESVAGFRVSENLAWGRHLYVDDLSTLPAARGQGHAGALLDWLVSEALKAGCRQMHLDSGVGTDRVDAHRLYFAKGFRIASHHFSRSL